MMTVMLYGFLGKKFGKVHRYAVRTPAEAVKALCATLPGFKKDMAEGGYYKVSKGDTVALTVEQLGNPQSTKESIRIVPVAAGAGKAFSVILGVVLVALDFFVFHTGYLTKLGAGLIVGGIAQLLFTPKGTANQSVEAAENKPSYAFDGAVNTVAQGNPVPVCYGKLLVGSQIISAGLYTEAI